MTTSATGLPLELAEQFPVLVIAPVETDTAVARCAEAITDSLNLSGLQVLTASTLDDGETAVSSDPITAASFWPGA